MQEEVKSRSGEVRPGQADAYCQPTGVVLFLFEPLNIACAQLVGLLRECEVWAVWF